MKRVTLDIGTVFQLVEDALQDAFPPDLFKGSTSQIPGRAVTGMPFKQAKINLPDPTQIAGANCMVFYVIT